MTSNPADSDLFPRSMHATILQVAVSSFVANYPTGPNRFSFFRHRDLKPSVEILRHLWKTGSPNVRHHIALAIALGLNRDWVTISERVFNRELEREQNALVEVAA